ncbi:MAG: hypothetical protein AAGJ82_06210 [Bacteroidota bacterium]
MLAPLTIQQLQNRFYLEKCPFWFAYEANAKRRMVGRFRDDEEGISEEERLDYGWMQLEELLQSFPYGKVHIVLKKTESSRADNSPNYIVEWGVRPGRGGQSAVTPTGVGAIGNAGAGNWAMMQYFLQEQQRLTRELQAAQMDSLRAGFENQMLQTALEEENAPSMQEELLKEGIGVVKTYLTSRNMQRPVHVGTMGQREEQQLPEAQPPVENAKTPQAQPFSIDAAMGYVQAITDLFPQYNRIEVLKAFLAFAKSNHAIVESQLAQYIGQNG